MRIEELAEDLERINFTRLSTIYGGVDEWSLTASYNFSSSELRGHFSRDSIPEALRTVYHETTHLNQMAATNYGIYCQTLRARQTELVQAIVDVIKRAG